MSKEKQRHGVIISMRVRNEDYPVIEDIAKKLFAQGQIKSPKPAALTKVALNVLCNQFLQLEQQQKQIAEQMQTQPQQGYWQK